jgi:hypothetical protein
MLPETGEVHEAQIDNFNTFLLDKADNILWGLELTHFFLLGSFEDMGPPTAETEDPDRHKKAKIVPSFANCSTPNSWLPDDNTVAEKVGVPYNEVR